MFTVMDIEDIKMLLKQRLSKKRLTHSLNVADEAVKLAETYGENKEKAYLAGLLHDVCKEVPFPEQKEMVIKSQLDVERTELSAKALWHAIAGAAYVRDELKISDSDILNAIRYHTIGRAGMSRLEEIVYLADLISIDRTYKDVGKIRKLAYTDVNAAMLESLNYAIESVLRKGSYLPHYTAEAYNQYVYIGEMMTSGKENE